MNITNKQEIEGIGNYYGGLNIGECEGRFYWSIENYDGDYWVEIPETLYRELTALVGIDHARRIEGDTNG